MIFPDINNIKERRIKLGINQKELAQRAGVSQSLIAKLEKGKIEVSYSIVKKIFLLLESMEHKNEKKASDIMSNKVYFLKKTDSIKAAKEMMKNKNISQIPIIEKNKSIGSISESDILDHFDEDINSMRVENIISPAFPIIDTQTPISTIISLLKYSGAVLVSKEGNISGIITKSDLI